MRAEQGGACHYAVFGKPIAHSLSPRIHAAFAKQLGIAIEYRTIEADQADFAQRLADFQSNGGRGANVTLPLKQDALTLCATLSERARRCGSVNTITLADNGWHGDSTDGAGLLRDLSTRHAFDLAGKRILLLGAGGAARAVAFAFVDAGVAELMIANRTHQRAQELANALGSDAVAIAWNAANFRTPFDVIVNATAVGHSGDAFDLPVGTLSSETLCVDLSYAKAARPFTDWARAAGVQRIADGLGMLIEQAAESFALWHGVRPATDPVYAELGSLSIAR